MNLEEYLETHTQVDLVKLIRRAGGTVTQGAISQWRKKGRVPIHPINRALQLEIVTGGMMTRQELRPDVYPEDS